MWNSQNSNLKKELMDYIENLFGIDTFNKTLAMAAAGKYLKYMRETYRRHLKQNDKYKLLSLKFRPHRATKNSASSAQKNSHSWHKD
jgi:DNA mismatch repair ATPase MutS